LTSGYAPLGAVAMKPEIAATFDDRVYEGGLTYNGHPISLAAAIAVIDVIQQDRLVEKACQTGETLLTVLKEMAVEHPSVGEVRSIGLFAAIELVKNRETREPMAPYGGSSPEMNAVKQYLLEHGVFAYTHWNIILVIPPLIITQEQLAEGLAVINDALSITDKNIN
jgi:taurine--2-oxoglutarate transaminase